MRPRAIFHGWVVLGVAVVVIATGVGTLFSLGVFLDPIQASTGWSRTGISSLALINWLGMGVGSLLWGTLSDRVGSRRVVLAGGLLLGLGLVLSSQASTLWQLRVTFGGLVGLAVGAFYTPLTATATRWFTARRGLAVGTVSGGMGLGILVVGPLARVLIDALGWRTAMLVLGDLAWLVIVPAALLLRERPGDIGAVALGGAAAPGPQAFTPGQVVRSPQFWAIALTHFACCAAHSGPIFHMVSHAIDQGLARMAAATVLGLSGLSSIVGRVGGGLVADRVGARLTLLAGLALQAGAILGYLLVDQTRGFVGLALVFGLAYGGVMPLFALVTREYFGDRVMGTAFGAVFLLSSAGMGLGSLAGGLIHDRLGSYAWLFIASGLIGGMAAILALTFRPPRRAAPPPVGVAGLAR